MMSSFDINEKPLEKDEEACFYNLCVRKPRQFTWCPTPPVNLCRYSYRFKHTAHRMICGLFAGSMVFFMLAIIVPLVLYSITNDIINYEVVIDSTSAPNYDLWHTNAHGTGYDQAKVHMDLYYFDLQNHDDVLYQAAKPILVEKGPYAYDEYYYRFDIEWTDDGDTVSYFMQKYYIFNQERTGPGLQEFDKILMPYPTVVGFKYVIDEIPPEANEYFDKKVEQNLTNIERNLIGDVNSLVDKVIESERQKILPTPERDKLVAKLTYTNQSIVELFSYLDSFLEQSSIPLVLFKTMMCNAPSGLSPFWRASPSMSWFGWLNDPILLQIQQIINDIKVERPNATIPWTSAVPGPTTNWTSVDEVRRRRNKDTFKTGKKNPKQVGLYVSYQNMSTVWACIHPARSINQAPYVEGEEFPACAHFQRDWTDAQAIAHGYQHPFDGDYANRAEGSDCTLFGRPLTSRKAQVFISDVFRSAYAEVTSTEKWYHDIPVQRFGIQQRDIYNASINPNNAQYYSFGPTGLLNLTMADNLPVFVTFPHFYMADTSLVEAVVGVQPIKEIHETIVDVEPNTGALVRAKKRLQVNYQIDSTAFPQISQESEEFANAICANISSIVAELVQLNVIDPSQVPDYECNTLLLTPFFLCLASAKGNWTIRNDRIFHPYGWTQEAAELPESDAADWNNTLFMAYRLADGIRLWCSVIGGVLLLVMSALIYVEIQRKKQLKSTFVKNPVNEEHSVIQPLIPEERMTMLGDKAI